MPPPEARTFRWFNNDGGLLENGLGPAPMNAPVPDVFRRRLDVMENGARTGGAGVIVNPPGAPVAPGEPLRVMVFRPQATVMVADDSGTLQVRTDRGEQMLTVRNPDGEVVFSGPIKKLQRGVR